MANPWEEYAAAESAPWKEFAPVAAPTAAAAAPPRTRTLGEAASDIATSVVEGTGNLLGGTAELVNVATGGLADKAVRKAQGGLGYLVNGTYEDGPGISGAYAGLQDEVNASKSDVLRTKQQELADTKGFFASAGKVLTDPTLLTAEVAKQAPNLALMAGGSGATLARGLAGAEARGLTGASAEAAARRTLERQLVATAAIQEAGPAAQQAKQALAALPESTWQDNPDYRQRVAAGESPEAVKESMGQWAAAKAAGIGGLAGALGGKLTAGLEGRFFTRSLDAPTGGLAGFARSTAAAVGREAGEETIQEGGSQIGTNVGVRGVDANQGLLEGVPEAAGTGAALGGLFGGAINVSSIGRSRTLDPGDPRRNGGAGDTLALPPPGPIIVDANGDAVTPSQMDARARGTASAGGSDIIEGEFSEVAPAMQALPPPGGLDRTIDVAPDGTAVTPEQAGALRTLDVDLARGRSELGLTPDVNQARARNPAAAPNTLPDGSPLPSAASGPLSRVVNLASSSGALDAAARARAQDAALEEIDAGAARGKTAKPAPRLDPATGEMSQQEWTPERTKSYLAAQAERGPLAAPDAIARAFDMTPRAAAELRRQVLAEKRLNADRDELDSVTNPPVVEDATDVVPVGGTEPQRPGVDGDLGTGSDRSAPADMQGGAAGEAVVEQPGAAAPVAEAAPQPAAIENAGGPDARSVENRPSPPRQQVGVDAAGWVNQNAQFARDQADRAGLTGEIESLFADGQTAKDVTQRLASRLGFLPVEERGSFIVQVRATLGIPSRATAEGKAEFDDWKAARDRRTASSSQDTVSNVTASPPQPALSPEAEPAAGAVQAAAAEAATSPTNDRPEPTAAQKEAGNFKVGRMKVAGLDVSIENPAGTKRKADHETLTRAYGYFRGTVGKDKDHVDVFLGDRAEDPNLPVFVIDQVDKSGKFDEHKVVLGEDNADAAREAYLSNYPKGWTGVGGVTQMTQEQFKAWVRDPAKTKRRLSAAPRAAAPAAAPTTSAKVSTTKGRSRYVEGAPETLQAYFQPGRVVEGYGGQDRVIAFKPRSGTEPWSVRVISVDKDGVPVPGARERVHTTLPQQRDLVRVLGKPQAKVRGTAAAPVQRAANALPTVQRETAPAAPEGRRQWRKGDRRDARGRPLLEPVLDYKEDGLLQWLGQAGGVDFEQVRAQGGADPALLKDGEVMRPFGRVGWPALRKNDGLSLEAIREKMQEDGWLPEEDPNAPPRVGVNDALDLVMDAINGRVVRHPTLGNEARAEQQQSAMRDDEERRDAELSTELGFEDVAAMYVALDQAEERDSATETLPEDYDQASSILDIMERAFDGGFGLSAEQVERIIADAGSSESEQAAALLRAIDEREGNGTQGQANRRPDRPGETPVSRKARSLADTEAIGREAEAGGESREQVTPASPAPQAGLFAAPTARETVDAARRDRDAERDGRTGSGRTDIAAGGGELFAGPRPEQAAIPDGSGRIDDLGEKIGGARKDQAAARPATSSEAPPKYEVSEGRVAGRWYVRDAKTKKLLGSPTGYGSMMFASSEDAQAHADSINAATSKAKANDGAWRKRYVVMQNVSGVADAKLWAVIDTKTGRALRGAQADTEAEAEAMVPLLAVAVKHRVLAERSESGEQYAIWREVTDRKRVKVVKDSFATREAALAYMAKNAAAILDTNTRFGEEVLVKPDTVRRIGAARRTGDVTGQSFIDTFGFRGVEFGNWNNQADRQELMNHAYDGMLDLADQLGFPPRALTLNGELSLAFGARGQGLSGARAHYERNYGVINLTKMNGAGSLAHEWMHALDHYLGRQDGKASNARVVNTRGDSVMKTGGTGDYLSHGSSSKSGLRAELRAAYDNVTRTIATKAEQFVQDTEQTQRFVGKTHEALSQQLQGIRTDIARQLDASYYKRNNKPATEAQLAEFDALAASLMSGPQEFDFRYTSANKAARNRGALAGRFTNDTLEAMSSLYKTVRGRSGFTAEKTGALDRVRANATAHNQRLAMLASALRQDTQTKRVPTRFAMDAKAIDQGAVTDYWTTPHELAARAFSAYVEDRIADRAGVSDFLSFGSDNVYYRELGIRPFPEGTERVAINDAFDALFQTMQTEETAEGNVRLFSRADRSYTNALSGLKAGSAVPALDATQVRSIATTVLSKWKAAPRMTVVDTEPDGVPKGTEGWYDQETGGITLVAANLRGGYDPVLKRNVTTAERIRMVTVHEAVGHAGVEAITGEKLWSQLQTAVDRMRDSGQQADLFRSLDRRYPNLNRLTDRSTLTREAIAVMAEKGVRNSVMDRVTSAVRRFIRNTLGIDLAISDAEVRQHIISAARYVATGQGAVDAPGGQTADAFASRPELNLAKEVQVTVLQGGKFGSTAPGVARETARARAYAWLEGMRARSASIKNDDTGLEIALSRAGNQELRAWTAKPERIELLAALPMVTKRAVLASMETETLAKGSARRWATFYAPVRIGGELRIARLVARDGGRGNFVYDLQASDVLEKQSPAEAGLSGDERVAGTKPGALAAVMTVAQIRDAVNAVERPGWFMSRRDSALSVDGRGQQRLTLAGETFVEQGGRYYMADAAGAPQDFRSLARAQAAAAETGAEVLVDDAVEGQPPSWSVVAPQVAVREALASSPLFSRQDPGEGNGDGRVVFGRAADFASKIGGKPRNATPAWFNDDQRSAAAKIATFKAGETLGERVQRVRQNAAARFTQRVFDQFRPLKTLNMEAFMQAHMSKGTDGALEAAFEFGTPKLKQGAFTVEERSGGFRKVMADLKGEHDTFLMWVVGNRADALKIEGREHLFTDDEIIQMKRLNLGKMEDGTSRQAAYARALSELNRYNRAFLDIAQSAGLINGESRKVWEDGFYIPFYRSVEEDPSAGPGQVKGLLRQRVIERLLGGTETLGDPMENILANWSTMLTASMKNMAANKALDSAVEIESATKAEGPGKGIVWAMRDGTETYFKVHDPLVLEALESLSFTGYDNPLMRAAGAFKRVLTTTVTIAPSFRIRNVARDVLSALATAEVGYNPVSNIVNGWRATEAGGDTRVALTAGGGAIRFGGINDGDQASHAKRLIAMGVQENQILDTSDKIKNAFRRFYDGWQELGDRTETINRAVLFDRVLAGGGTLLEANFAARDLMNFTSMGSSSAVRALSQVLPFFNARLQGADRLVRGAANNPRRFTAVAGAVAMASALLFLINKDDDDYKNLPDYVRDYYWPIKLAGKWVYIPKPFEVGALGSIVERGTELALAGDDYQAKDFGRTLLSLLSGQLAMNPIPQIARPVTEAAFNFDLFRMAPIDGMGQQNMAAQDRFTARTSAAAVLAGRATNMSPQRIEHMVRGYFGWIGIQALNASDYMLRGPAGLAANPNDDLTSVSNVFVLGDFVKEPTASSSKYVTRFFESQRAIDQIYASANQARKTGDAERDEELRADPRLRMRPLYAAADKQITKIGQQIKTISNSRELTATEKNRRIENLNQRRARIARQADERARRLADRS